MKKKLLLLFFVISLFAQGQTIPNAGFENWTVDIFDNNNPDDWETSNADWQGEKITKAPGYQGIWALKTLNYFTTNSPYAKCRFPVSNHPLSLNAFVKTMYLDMDSVKIQVIIYYNGLAVDSGQWNNTTLSPVSIWTPVLISISQFSVNADSAEILITGGKKGGTPLFVDELSFTVTGVNENINNCCLTLVPNPATSELIIDNGELKIEIVEIYDVMGREYLTLTVKGTSASIDISGLAPGIYFVRARTEKGSVTKKLIKQ